MPCAVIATAITTTNHFFDFWSRPMNSRKRDEQPKDYSATLIMLTVVLFGVAALAMGLFQ